MVGFSMVPLEDTAALVGIIKAQEALVDTSVEIFLNIITLAQLIVGHNGFISGA
jgi:hypothetical protein